MLPERIQSKSFAIVVGIFPETGGRSDEVQGQLRHHEARVYLRVLANGLADVGRRFDTRCRINKMTFMTQKN